jgi:hypothetical protein
MTWKGARTSDSTQPPRSYKTWAERYGDDVRLTGSDRWGGELRLGIAALTDALAGGSGRVTATWTETTSDAAIAIPAGEPVTLAVETTDVEARLLHGTEPAFTFRAKDLRKLLRLLPAGR